MGPQYMGVVRPGDPYPVPGSRQASGGEVTPAVDVTDVGFRG